MIAKAKQKGGAYVVVLAGLTCLVPNARAEVHAADSSEARHAEHPEEERSEDERSEGDADAPPVACGCPPSPGRRVLAAGAALVPGVLVHGSGNLVLGRTQTAGRLLLLQGVGIGLAGAGAAIIVGTGAARDYVGLGASLAIVGGGLLTTSLLADLYSVLTPTGGLGADPGWLPILEAELGYAYVYDPQFAYRNFAVNRLHARLDGWRLSPSLWASPNDANQRFRAELAYRFFGPRPESKHANGNFAEAEVAFTEHRFGFEDFRLTTFEASVKTRWDLKTYDSHLAGAFVDLSLGLGNQLYDFGPVPGGVSSSRLLLGGFGFGLYLGDQSPTGGYVRIYYDHRHDGFAAGTLAGGVGSGAIGHFGVDGLYYFARHWGVRAEAQRGSAMVLGVSGLFRFGGDR